LPRHLGYFGPSPRQARSTLCYNGIQSGILRVSHKVPGVEILGLWTAVTHRACCLCSSYLSCKSNLTSPEEVKVFKEAFSVLLVTSGHNEKSYSQRKPETVIMGRQNDLRPMPQSWQAMSKGKVMSLSLLQHKTNMRLATGEYG
jgi:hypothetical protein